MTPSELSVRGRLALGMIVFGSATPVSKIVAASMPPFVASLLRVAAGALVLLPFVAGRWASVRTMQAGDWLRVGVIALVGMFGFTALMLYGMRSVSGVAGAVVMSTTPAVTAIGSVLFLRERVTWRKALAIVLAVTGVLVMHVGGGVGDTVGSGVSLGMLLVLGAVCCEACYTLLGKRVSEDVDPLVTAFLAALLALPVFVPFALGESATFEVAAVGARAWVALSWYGAGTLALGSWLWYSGIARAEGVVAAGFMGLMPVSALVLSYVLLDEPLRLVHVAGFGTVFAGVLLISWEHAQSHGEP